MDKFADNIKTLIAAVQPYAWVLIVVGLITIGVMFAIPSEKAREKAKASAPWIIVGTLLIAGAIYIGDWIFAKITF
ncbi:MAG: hypothetical protein NC293_03095 [Roseburia sp.]|nr:hypothetical protein [Roseburia sp.]